MIEINAKLIEAHIFKLEEDGSLKFLLLKRHRKQYYPGIWQMVTGKVKDEPAYKCAKREIKEETGLTPIKFWVAPNVNSFYSAETDSITLVPVFAAKVDKDEVVISDEHEEFKWVGKEEAIKLLAWEGQRKSVRLIEEYFTKEISFLNFVEVLL